MSNKSAATEVQEAFAHRVQELAGKGVPLELIAEDLRAHGRSAGREVIVSIVEPIPGIRGLEIKLGKRLDRPSVACQHGPHTPCPVCKADVCWNGMSFAQAAHTVCGTCTSFLVRETDSPDGPLHVMTDEELMALSDDLRIGLQRARRTLESRRG